MRANTDRIPGVRLVTDPVGSSKDARPHLTFEGFTFAIGTDSDTARIALGGYSAGRRDATVSTAIEAMNEHGRG